MLLDLRVMALGEMVVGTPSREASAILTCHLRHSPGMRCPLAWRDPSAFGVEV